MSRLASKILIFLAAFLLIAAAGLAAIWNLGRSQADLDLPLLIPDDPDVTLTKAITNFRASARSPAGSSLAEVKAAAGLDPLEDEPILLASLANTHGDHAEAIELLEEARRRNPAGNEVRIFLLDRYLRAGKIAQAIGEIGSLNALLPAEKRKDLMQILLGLVAAPETRHQAIAVVVQSPMRKPLIGELAKAGASSYLLLDLSKDLGSLALESDDAQWSQSVTQTLVQHGDLAGARRLWQFYFDDPPATSGIFDPFFKGLAGPPFGWQISSQAGSYAQRQADGLRVRYEGRDPAFFARQLLMLVPGSYRLDYGLAKSEGRPPNLAWRIDCLSSGRTLLDLSFQQNYSFEEDQSPEFSVPADGCPGQWIALSGRPMPGPSMRTALITHVQLSRLGSQ